MTIKHRLTTSLRAVLPERFVDGFETIYRKLRIHIVSAWFGNPGKRLHVIGVTGTNGKTTTSHYINKILHEAGYTTAMFTTTTIEIAGYRRANRLNMTVASTAQMQRFLREARRAYVDFVVLEVTSHALHQYKLATTPIEMAILTNLTQDHLDYHATMESYARTKAQLLDNLPPFIVLNRDDDWYDYFNQYQAGIKKVSYGESPAADVRICDIKARKRGSDAKIILSGSEPIVLCTALPGEVNVMNATAAATAASLLSIPIDTIIRGIAQLEGVPGRFEYIIEDNPFSVVIDYAHTPDALKKLLIAQRSTTSGRIFLVFGACGDRDKSKRPIMGAIAAEYADKIFLTDEENYTEDAAIIRQMIRKGIVTSHGIEKTSEIPDRQQAIAQALTQASAGDTVLITGLGHEVFRIIDGKRVPWSDKEVVRQLLHLTDFAS